MSASTATATVELTPAMLAQAFWGMGSDQQTEFFRELKQVVTAEYAANPKSWAWGLGEMQWLYMGEAMEKDGPAREMLMAMAAPLYMHTLMFTEGRAA